MSFPSINIEDKICALDDLKSRLSSAPRPLVMTNGVFDVLHRGHVAYLNKAAELGATLLVAVNSDRSVRLLRKGPGRPLNSAENRAYLLAGLAAVDLLTFFDTLTPVDLINVIRPDVYVKGGDYNIEALAETRAVRSWGGDAVAIPFVDGFSTTKLVNRMRRLHAPYRTAAFLDRDGVINKDKEYVYRWDDFEFLPGAIEGMRTLQNAGYVLVIVTNQSGIARGFYTEEQFQALNNSFRACLAEQEVDIGGIFHCPHHPQGTVRPLTVSCECRKPGPGLLLNAAAVLGLDLANSLMIGDRQTDIQAARAAGVGRAYCVSSDQMKAVSNISGADGYFASLFDCARQILVDDRKDTE